MAEDVDRAEIIALAKAIHRRMRDWEEAHGQPFKKENNLSRLLENDPTYEPYRKRDPDKQRGPAVAPGVFTIKRLAEQLDTTVGDLLGEREFDVTVGDRRRIRGLLETGEIAAANAALGYNYFSEGTVVPGKRLGRTIGFPTLNLAWSPELRPRLGVYAVCVCGVKSSVSLHGVANYGLRPTVEQAASEVVREG